MYLQITLFIELSLRLGTRSMLFITDFCGFMQIGVWGRDRRNYLIQRIIWTNWWNFKTDQIQEPLRSWQNKFLKLRLFQACIKTFSYRFQPWIYFPISELSQKNPIEPIHSPKCLKYPARRAHAPNPTNGRNSNPKTFKAPRTQKSSSAAPEPPPPPRAGNQAQSVTREICHAPPRARNSRHCTTGSLLSSFAQCSIMCVYVRTSFSWKARLSRIVKRSKMRDDDDDDAGSLHRESGMGDEA